MFSQSEYETELEAAVLFVSEPKSEKIRSELLNFLIIAYLPVYRTN